MYKNTPKPYAIVIGRFQPYHLGHHFLLKKALTDYKKVCLVLGSAESAPSIKNPFTPKHREELIRLSLTDEENAKLICTNVRDYPYNDNTWLASVRTKALTALNCTDYEVHLLGHFKDKSSFYLNMFPNWEFLEITPYKLLAATDIRISLLSGTEDWKLQVPKEIVNNLVEYTKTDTFYNLQKEFEFIEQYKKDTQFVNAKFKPTFVTTDVVLIQSGHVLVVKRKFNPGKGLYALPGGFVNTNETIKNSAIRELKEETKVQVDRKILEANVKAEHIFDNPERSLRGRTITVGYHIELPDSLKHGLPDVIGSDDAEEALWMPLADLSKNEDKFFEDHPHIIRFFTKTI